MVRAGLLGFRPGEGRLLARVAGTFAIVECARGLGEVGADTLVTSGPQGVAVLPPLYVALGVVGMALTVGYGAMLPGVRGDRFFPGLMLAIAMVLLLAWLASLGGGQTAASLLWVAVAAAGGLLVTVSWTVAGRVFHARQARRLFPLCASAAIAGSFVGQLAAGPIAHAVGTAQLVVLEALLLSAAALVVARIGGPLRATILGVGPVHRTLAEGAGYVARSSLLRLIALAYVLFAVLLVGVSFTFMGEVREAFPDEAQRATALGLFSAAVTAVAFLVSTLVANRLTARFGVTATALTLPVVYLAGFLLWLGQLSLATAAGVRFAQVVTQRGISNAAWSSFFNVVPAARRAQVMAFIDGVPGQLGTILTGLLLMVGLTIGRDLFLGAAVVSGACLVVVIAIRRAYVTSLVATLRDGIAVRVLERGPDLGTLVADPGVLEQLLAGIDAPEASRRRIVAGLLGGASTRPATDALERLAADPDAGVRATAIDALTEAGAGLDVARTALDDDDADVRAAAVTLLGSRPGVVAALGPAVIERLAVDPAPSVRAAFAVAAAGTPHEPVAASVTRGLLAARVAEARSAAAGVLGARPMLLPDGADRLLALLDDPSDPVRRAAARAIASGPTGGPRLVSAVVVGSVEAGEAALGALADGPDLAPDDRDRLLAWGARALRRARALRDELAGVRALTAMSSTTIDATDALRGLERLLEVRAREATDRLLAVLRALCPSDVGAAILRSLPSASAETRAQATEALEVVVGGSFAREVAALLDEAPFEAAGRPAEVLLTELAADPDPWVRVFALRTLWATPAGSGMVDRLATDPDPIVHMALGDPDSWRHAPMPHPTSTALGSVDRMLLLGRVPLFAGLSPEDLARIATTANEVSHAADDMLILEGDAGDHLVVIVEGSVRVVTGPVGEERLVRRCGPGEHIGELAMLRHAPRAASVIADPPGVRALLLDADGLRSVLRERPDAAMAMLATLADRISRQ